MLPLGKKKVLNLQKVHFGHKLKCLKILQLDFFFFFGFGPLVFLSLSVLNLQKQICQSAEIAQSEVSVKGLKMQIKGREPGS